MTDMTDADRDPKVIVINWTPDVCGYTCVDSTILCKDCGHITRTKGRWDCEACGSCDVKISTMYRPKGD